MIHVRQHPDGKHAIVDIHATEDSWHGHYRFVTHGMSAEDAAAARNAITEHHRLKSERHEGFNRIERMVDGFHIHGLAIIEQGTDVRLILRVTTPDGSILNLDCAVPSVADLPSDAEITATVRDAAAARTGRDGNAASEHIASVKAALGLQ